jgi:hypothetical protein
MFILISQFVSNVLTDVPGGKGRSARKADNPTAMYELIVYKMWEPQVSQRYKPP